jgi:hypothetical protein
MLKSNYHIMVIVINNYKIITISFKLCELLLVNCIYLFMLVYDYFRIIVKIYGNKK